MPNLNVEFTVKGIKDLIDAFNQASQAAQGLQDILQQPRQPRTPKPPTWQQKLTNLFNSTRVGFGGGGFNAMPLIGSIAKMIGPEATVITALVGALGALEAAVTQTANAFTKLEFALGSNGSVSSRLAGIGAGVGMSPEAVGAASARFQSTISNFNDPVAVSTALRMGIFNPPRPFGGVDEGKNLLKAIEELRAITDKEEQIRRARILKLEDFSQYYSMSQTQADFMKGQQNFRSTIFDPQFQQDAADLAGAFSGLKDAVMNLLAAIGKPMMHALAEILDDLATFINSLAAAINYFDPILRKIITVAQDLGAASPFKAWHDLNAPMNDALNDHKDSIDRNTQALNANTQALYPGRYIGSNSQRLNSAMPVGVGGEYLRHAQEYEGFRLSRF